MSKVTYEIVEHDGGWAYRVNGVFSEPFPSHDLARQAAERAAGEQRVPGDTTGGPPPFLKLAEAIVHEYFHNELFLHQESAELFDTRDELYYSPWRDDARPLNGLFHGAFVFTAVAASRSISDCRRTSPSIRK
jgi:HEXXH motif-containing protein